MAEVGGVTRVTAAPRHAGTVVVVGVGASRGLGAALVRRFAAEGLHVFAAGRTLAKVAAVAAEVGATGGRCTAFVADASRDDDVTALFDAAEAAGPLAVAAYNGGGNRWKPTLDTDTAFFERLWRDNTLAGFVLGREAARRMLPRGRGTLLFTSASAALRGRPTFAAFAAAKGGLRLAVQSMAREWGPLGLHVANVVIDGAINGERIRRGLPELAAAKGEEGLLDLEAIAESFWQLHVQPRSAWTLELDLRPFSEPF